MMRTVVCAALCVAVGLATSAAGASVKTTAKLAPRAAAYPTASQVLQLWERKSPFGAEIIALHRVFPNEMLTIAQTVINKARAGESAAAIEAYASKARQDLLVDNAWFIALAPDDRLKTFVDGQATLLATLEKSDADACVAVALGGHRRGARAAAAEAVAVDEIGLLEAGRATPVRRPLPTPEDISALSAGMKRLGATDGEAGMVMLGSFAGRTPAEVCHAHVVMTQALAALPVATAARIEAAYLTPPDTTAAHNAATQTPEQRIIQTWAHDEILGDAMARLVAEMPDEMNPLIAAMAGRLAAGDPAGEDDVFTDGFRRLIAAHMDAVEGGSIAPLYAFGEAETAYVKALQAQDPRCGFGDPPAPVASAAVDAANKRALKALAEALLAAHANEASGTPLLRRTVTAADRQMLTARLRVIVGEGPILQALLDGKTKSLPPQDRCAANLAMLQAMTSSPEPAMGDLLADYLRRSYAAR